MVRGLVVMGVGALLTGCGAAKVVTVTTPTPAAEVVATTTTATKTTTAACASGITLNAHASCGFATAILIAYSEYTGEEENGAIHLNVESPATHKTYAVECVSAGTKLIGCEAGDAKVTLSFSAVAEARARQPVTPTATLTPGTRPTAYPNCPFGAHVVSRVERESGERSRCLRPDGAEETPGQEKRAEEHGEERTEAEAKGGG